MTAGGGKLDMFEQLAEVDGVHLALLPEGSLMIRAPVGPSHQVTEAVYISPA